MIGQANLHRNPDCAAVLANHIYTQMRVTDVLSSGNSYNRNQTLKPNPRRAGLPSTVTEWKAQRDQAARRNKDGDNQPREKAQESGQEETVTAFDIINSGKPTNLPLSANSLGDQSTNRIATPSLRRSKRINCRNEITQDQPSQGVPNAVLQLLNGQGKQYSNRMRREVPLLTLSTQDSNSASSQSSADLLNDDPAIIEAVDLGKIVPTRKKKGLPLEAFVYAIQEPAVISKKLVNIKNVIQIMDTKCLERKKKPVNPRAAIICSIHLNMWPVTELCTRDMAVGLLQGSSLGDIYVVSLYCDGANPKAVPDEFKRFRKIAKKEDKQILLLMDSNSHSETLWASKRTCTKGREWERYMS